MKKQTFSKTASVRFTPRFYCVTKASLLTKYENDKLRAPYVTLDISRDVCSALLHYASTLPPSIENIRSPLDLEYLYFCESLAKYDREPFSPILRVVLFDYESLLAFCNVLYMFCSEEHVFLFNCTISRPHYTDQGDNEFAFVNRQYLTLYFSEDEDYSLSVSKKLHTLYGAGDLGIVFPLYPLLSMILLSSNENEDEDK